MWPFMTDYMGYFPLSGAAQRFEHRKCVLAKTDFPLKSFNMASTTAQAKPSWRIQGYSASACNCAWGCPCQFNARPSQGYCQAAGVWRVETGYFGATRLDGVTFAGIVSFPGAVHEGNGTMQPVFDEKTTAEQREAIAALMSAPGATFLEIISTMCPHQRKPIVAPIEFEADSERRVARIRIPGVLDVDIQPIKNPITGEEHRARIDLPNGFEYKQAEVANAGHLSATCEAPLAFSLRDTHSHLNRIDWSNAA